MWFFLNTFSATDVPKYVVIQARDMLTRPMCIASSVYNITVGQSSLISLSLSLLQLTSGKPLWLYLQPVDTKSRWRHNWKSAQVVNSYTYYVRPHNPATGFWPSSATWSLLQCGLYWTVLLRNRDTALPVEGNGDLQTLICVQLRWDPNGVTHCQILSSDKAEWRLIPTTLCRCQMKTLIPGWAIMVHDTHTRRKSSYCWALTENPTQGIKPLRVTPNLGSGPSFWNCGAFAILL